MVGSFRPPSVPDGISRLRLTAHAGLSDAELDRACDVITTAIKRGLMITIVTGTDTGVGKTVVTAALAVRRPRPAGRGREAGPDRRRPPTNPATSTTSAASPACTDLYEGVRLRDPLAPTTAARRQGVALPSAEIHAKSIDGLAADHEIVLVEGAGGLLVGLDDDGGTPDRPGEALTKPFAFVVVTRAGLGTLNHTGLTVEALRARGLPIAGLVIGSWPEEPDLAEQCNLEDLPATDRRPGDRPDPGRCRCTTTRTPSRRLLPGWFDVTGCPARYDDELGLLGGRRSGAGSRRDARSGDVSAGQRRTGSHAVEL